MNSLMKRLSAVAMAVGILMATNISYLSTEPFIANAAESETSDAEETVHIWDGTTDVSWYDDEETEFHISTPEQLAGMAAIVNTGKTMEGKTFILDNDIYLNDVSTYDEWETTPPENKWTPLKSFSGTFLGNGHSVIGYYGETGMFDKVSNGYISELNLSDVYICYSRTECLEGYYRGYDTEPYYEGYFKEGGLTNYAEYSLIVKCSVQGIMNLNGIITISSGYNSSVRYTADIGGIAASNYEGKIINCYNNLDIKNYMTAEGKKFEYIGGICGSSLNASVVNCVNYGSIDSERNPYSIGGICGENKGKISNCKNCGEINYGGGICGVNEGKISNCYNTSKKSRNGICVSNIYDIKNVYNTGMVFGSYSVASGGTITNAYYLSGTAIEGGPNTIAKTEANMKKESFADSLGEAFYYVEGEYPKLAFEVGRTVSNFDKTSLSFNEYGETQTLTLDTTYLGTPEWVSSDTSVATVDENGVVTAVGNGTAMIYALCSDSKAACSVSVGYDYYLSDNELSLKKGRVHDLTVYSASTNEEVTDVEIEWNSSDDSIVSVDNEGKLITNNKGTAAVTAKIADIELSCIVNVYEYTVPVTPTEDDKNAPQLSETEFTISTIESKKLSVLNYTDSITWVSSNTTIAKVNDQGLVRAVAEGQTSVYALLSDGKCLKANVTVTKSEYSMGDINLDGEFDVADVVLLQKWLLAVPDIELKHWENADFYEDGMLNVFDLCMMREQLIS